MRPGMPQRRQDSVFYAVHGGVSGTSFSRVMKGESRGLTDSHVAQAASRKISSLMSVSNTTSDRAEASLMLRPSVQM